VHLWKPFQYFKVKREKLVVPSFVCPQGHICILEMGDYYDQSRYDCMINSHFVDTTLTTRLAPITKKEREIKACPLKKYGPRSYYKLFFRMRGSALCKWAPFVIIRKSQMWFCVYLSFQLESPPLATFLIIHSILWQDSLRIVFKDTCANLARNKQSDNWSSRKSLLLP